MRNLKSSWSAGALALLGSFLFAASLFVPFVFLWNFVDNDTTYIAVIALYTLPWLRAFGWKLEHFQISVVAGTILAGSIVILGTYIGRRALVKDKKFTAIRDLAVAFAAKGGTSFRGADLTDSDFTEATLKSADFTGANLTRACWFHAQKLDHACVENTYLQYPQVQQLVITGIGQGQNFDRLNLQGINLQDTYLPDTPYVSCSDAMKTSKYKV